jgi:hypothetical protein
MSWRSARRSACAISAAIVATGATGGGLGCGNDDGRRIKRDRDAGPPVEVVDRTAKTNRSAGDEREPNGSDAEANPVAVASLVRGTLDGEADVDVYRVTVPRAGQLRVQVTGIEGVDLMLEVRDARGAVLARSDRGPAGTIEGMPNLGVVAGEYLVQVKEFVKARPKPKPAKKPKKGKAAPAPDAGVVGRVGPSPVYELTLDLVERPADLTEIEPDDDAGAAVEVLLADTVRGWIGWSGDVDVWKLSLEGVGDRYAVDVAVAGVEGVTLGVELVDAQGAPVQARKGAKGGPVTLESVVPALAADQPPWHYVKVSGDRSNPEAAYELRFTTRLLDADEESEPNDEAARATPLRFDGVATAGTMRATYVAGDVDRFVLEAQPEAVLLDVAVEPPAGIDVKLEIAALGGGLIAAGDAAAAGKRERLSGVAIPAGTAAVVSVLVPKPPKGDGGELRAYRLTWSFSGGELPMPPEEPGPGSGGDELPPEEPGPGGGEGAPAGGDDEAPVGRPE